MSIFKSILSKIMPKFSTSAKAGEAPAKPAPEPAPTASAAPAAPASAPVNVVAVDVEAVLVEIAAKKGGGGNWRTSIVDLLKLLDLDSSLTARKELAAELNVNAGPHGSAEQNIALIKAVWKALADNGGKVPASLRD
jgi:3-oxoacyl-ACP reductase-like protein